MARQFHRQAGDPRKYKVLSHYRSYHGVTGQALAASGWRASKSPYEPLAEGSSISQTPGPVSPALRRRSGGRRCNVRPPGRAGDRARGRRDDRGPDHRADPDDGGRRDPAGRLPAGAAGAVRRHDIVLVFDEIITGFGRTGHLFASELFSTWPDILVFGKGLTGGLRRTLGDRGHRSPRSGVLGACGSGVRGRSHIRGEPRRLRGRARDARRSCENATW